MSTIRDIYESLKQDSELSKLAEVAGVPMPAEAGNGGPGVDAQVAAAEGDQATAGHAVTDAVVNQVAGNVAAQAEAAKDQIMEAAATQNQAAAMSEVDEMPGMHQQPVMGEMLEIGEGTKEAAARIEYLVSLGLEKEAELLEKKAAEDTYHLGQIFGCGYNDFLAGKTPAFKKEASVLDTLGNYTEKELDAALDKLSDDEMNKIAALLDEKNEFEKQAAHWYTMGQEFARGASDVQARETVKTAAKETAKAAVKASVKK